MPTSRVYRRLEAAILNGTLRPRERLVEQELASRFGVSRTLIREALKALAARGLVTLIPYRGAWVVDLSDKDMADLCTLQVHLESLAAHMALTQITAQELETMRELNDQFARSCQRKDLTGMIDTNTRFHQVIATASRNSYLAQVIGELRAKEYIALHQVWSYPGRTEQSVRDHEEIIAALQDGDEERDGDQPVQSGGCDLI